MQQVDVYGVGNALVDIEYEVEEDFFPAHRVRRGVMTLVSHERQEEVIAALRERGDVRKMMGGGSVANSLYAISNFGGQTFFSCKIADDEAGNFYLRELGEHNIRTCGDFHEVETGRCLIMISPDAERTMYTFLGASEFLSPADLDFEAVRRSQYVYIEGYLVSSDSGRAAAIELREFAEANGVKTALSFSDPSLLEIFPGQMKEMLGGGLDLLFCNEEEACLWTGTKNLSEACVALRPVAKQFVVTRGANGSVLFDGSYFVEIDAHKVKAVDTTGAGDAFAGGFLYGLTSGRSFAESGRLASRAAGEVVSRFGPRLEAGDYQKILPFN
ncbi:MAG: adenosine kinase [Gammaproteobacteria bacterium]|nr:adenosine kinase [Gammaproteobacteria bacterium]MYH45125.1 adenosine kinase [Gammaproteobacteria bacterium]MYL13994.1 adenosine kinase [Gammaproteobacteria bacterium]